MSGLVTIFGGSGFLGRYIARRMARQGWRVRVATRHPNDAMFVRTYGVVGQVEPIFCNIRDDDSVRQALGHSDAVVNCVGILSEKGRNGFDAVQAEGAGRVARIAAEEGVDRMVHISAIGADETSDSDYARTKAMGEAKVLEHMPGAMILRPSIMFGAEDEFFNRFAGMTRFSPILPMVGGRTRFQPVYVDDVAAAAEMGALGTAPGGIYELGGPDTRTFREFMREMLAVIHRRRALMDLPIWMAKLMAFGLTAVQVLSIGLIHNDTLTADQIVNLQRDNVVSGDHKGFDDLGITPTATEVVLPDYLWRFRPSGQYDAIKDSARNLKA
ncbi:NADH ubiquinone oxidoreductase, putative [Pseudooceanicola batsensis HTCC2597]|uniref:NADH ubiquinone oxidoreductase, putative n=1 Tax=Pseudooceanicola batsensis (strain ATCC BAA-863 / DSM 15984 / KCTC 12145 / HTCC2597) TaxID=252305 RepID=A3TWF3_PSEBH|nr:complex I NDUFA9 subunit family protein [Pseudooceanicola batsensis]EAQ03949.1 NADH ubiquinone oxidoreductase, putative [Pseudooceanicola batsensis HTCC2597]